jgi:alkylation response protein AidB-like acyl-CoA dehydrogenase
MDFQDSPEEHEFRLRLREWLKEHNPHVTYGSNEYWEAMPTWHTSLWEGGFFGIGWPTEYGGYDLPPIYNVIVDEELANAGAPARPSLGYIVVGVLHHGSDEIKKRILPGLISGKERWCQGFSEPDSGSDLASLRTKAVRDGDDYLISGHKIWTSYSDLADSCFLLARTDPDVPKHKGISVFVVPMDDPGVKQLPLKMINGNVRDFGEVIFDEVRVPASNMIGEPGEGWRIAMTIVTHEREPQEIGYAARYSKTVKQLKEIALANAGSYTNEERRDLAWAIVEADMLQRHISRRLSDRFDGIKHGPEGSIDKLLMTWTEQTVGHAAQAIGRAPHDGSDPSMFNTYLYSRSASVMGGTEQIQRNLIASRILGLPS